MPPVNSASKTSAQHPKEMKEGLINMAADPRGTVCSRRFHVNQHCGKTTRCFTQIINQISKRNLASLLWCGFLITMIVLLLALPGLASPDNEVTRATLKNGLRVVIVHNSLAPAVTVEENYLAGGDETPPGFPGMAHAQEHMAFRGCAGLTGDQIAAIFAQLGGEGNADTQQDITQYFETVAAQDMEIALRVDSACMREATDSQAEWDKERGAIEQEVARDLSNPIYKFLVRANQDLFAGTPYATDPLGTKESFDATTALKLKDFYQRWYAPNNAILVIAGNVDPQKTLAAVKELYETIPQRPVPAHATVHLQPVKAEQFNVPSDYPYTLVLLAYRLPGIDSPDYAAARVLADVLASQRGDLYALVPAGKALDSGFQLAENYHKASLGIGYAAVPAGSDPAAIKNSLMQILAAYSQKGVPADLVAAAKRAEMAGLEFTRSSIPGLAAAWSEALAGEGHNSPEDDVNAIQRVTVADVNRVARMWLVNQQAVIGTLVPEPSGKPASGQKFGGTEQVTSAPTKPVQLPPWAESLVKKVEIPKWDLQPVDMRLSNGIRLIVQPENVSSMVAVVGEIRQEPDLETPPGKDGVSNTLDALFSYGTTSLDRLAFQKALDDIAANESAGSSFSLQVLHQYFDRGVQLLADNELHPALPEAAFNIVKQQTADTLAGLLKSPGYQAQRAMEEGLLPPRDPSLRQATPATVDALTLNDVKEYYSRTFRPDLTTIVVVGAITPEEAKASIEKWFGSWTTPKTKVDVDLPPVPSNHASSTDIPDPARVQDSVELAEEIPMNRFNPDYYPLQLGQHVLGGGFYATRLYRDLRETTGYVYNVANRLEAGRTRTVFSISYASDPANVSKARALAQRDLTEMQTTPVSPSELQQAKALLLRQVPLLESSESRIAGGLLARAVVGLPLDEPVIAAHKYFDMSAEQVRQAFAKWIRPEDFVQVVQGPPPK
jgi:zinc protease